MLVKQEIFSRKAFTQPRPIVFLALPDWIGKNKSQDVEIKAALIISFFC